MISVSYRNKSASSSHRTRLHRQSLPEYRIVKRHFRFNNPDVIVDRFALSSVASMLIMSSQAKGSIKWGHRLRLESDQKPQEGSESTLAPSTKAKPALRKIPATHSVGN